MQEVQRFNKVLKSLVLLGDLILLNLLLWGFNLLLGTRFWCVHFRPLPGILCMLLIGLIKSFCVIVQYFCTFFPCICHTDLLKMLQLFLCCQALHLLSIVSVQWPRLHKR